MPVIRSCVAQTAEIELDRLVLESRLMYPIESQAPLNGIGGVFVNALLGEPGKRSEFANRSEAQFNSRCADPQVRERVVRR